MPVRRSVRGDLLTDLIDEIFQVNGKLLRAGDALAADVGLTSARWQVLGAIGAEGTTMAQIARRRGLRRQGVREIVTRLREDGLVELVPNPDDRRAPLVRLTPKAGRLLAELHPAQVRWADALGETFTAEQLALTLAALRTLADVVDG